ncbi:MAG TPA: HEAT repeat domain-containing protein [Gemmatimonadales bacterium]|nr:HEAT repeat domain-containing protein [Gemmatimonadales bacterium]
MRYGRSGRLIRRLSADRADGGAVVLIGAGEVASGLTAEQLATALERAPDDEVAAALCFLIGHYDNEPATPAVPRLLDLLDSADPALRAEAADAIAHAISRGASPSEIARLRPDAETVVREALEREWDTYAREMLHDALAGLTRP